MRLPVVPNGPGINHSLIECLRTSRNTTGIIYGSTSLFMCILFHIVYVFTFEERYFAVSGIIVRIMSRSSEVGELISHMIGWRVV